MPPLFSLDTALLVITVFYALWEIYALIAYRDKILLPGTPFGKNIVTVLLAALCGLMLYLRQDMLELIWVHACTIGVCIVIYIFLKSGLGETGIYYSGRFFHYEKIRHYSVEREGETSFSLRFTKGLKDYMLDFPIERRELIVATMLKNSIPDMKSVPLNRKDDR